MIAAALALAACGGTVTAQPRAATSPLASPPPAVAPASPAPAAVTPPPAPPVQAPPPPPPPVAPPPAPPVVQAPPPPPVAVPPAPVRVNPFPFSDGDADNAGGPNDFDGNR